ncbi:MAG: hypothetical protein IPM47_20375 [Sphingobacteriales bacterium]|nr:MAG: hypothetical protein IPM47_20375 [Sphingobacteriales bacterium]
MAKLSYYLLLFMLGGGFVLVVNLTYIDIAVYKSGEIVKAKIEKVNCKRKNSHLDLNYLNSKHSILVPYESCINGVYQVGDSIMVKALPEYRRTQFSKSYEFVWGIIMLIVLTFIMVYWIVAKKEVVKYLSGKSNFKSS